jgi:hypothetical protein
MATVKFSRGSRMMMLLKPLSPPPWEISCAPRVWAMNQP